jgi:hypothetical protein
MDNGWIKLHRSISAWGWKHIPEMVALWIDLLISANHEEAIWEGMTIKRGQVITGRIKLSQNTGLSQQTIRTCLERLKSTNEIEIESTNRFSIITICKYEDYQLNENEINQQNIEASNKQLTSNQPAINQQLTTNKKNKKNKNIRIKERNITKKVFVPPTEQELETYKKENSLIVDCKFFLKYFTESGWIDSKGNPVRNWKQKLLTWSKNSSGIQSPAKPKGETTSITRPPSRAKQVEDERKARDLFEQQQKNGVVLPTFKEFLHGNNNRKEQMQS